MATVSHATLTGVQLHEPKGVAAATAGTVYVANGAGSGSWIGLLPVGLVVPYAGASAPSKFLFCFGQAISRSTYSVLFSAIGTAFGIGDGSTTFNLPDLRGRVVAGKDNMGGTSADRLTAATNSLDGDTLGATGGVETHTNTQQGTFSTGGPTGLISVTGGGSQAAHPQHGHSVTISGQTGAASSVQPTIILNYIIFTAV